MDIILSVTKQTYKLTQGKMKKFLLTTSVILSGIFPIFNSNTPVLAQPVEIGRASCRERVFRAV